MIGQLDYVFGQIVMFGFAIGQNFFGQNHNCFDYVELPDKISSCREVLGPAHKRNTIRVPFSKHALDGLPLVRGDEVVT